jgi:hypothetical protein
VNLLLRIKCVTHDRETGEVIKEEITDEVPDITREELNRPLAEIIYNRIKAKEKQEGEYKQSAAG